MDFLFNTFEYNLFGISNLAASLLSVGVGTLVLINAPKSKTHISFFLITLTGGWWLFSYFLITSFQTEANAYKALASCYLLAVPFISPTVYWFSSNWSKSRFPNWTVPLGYLIGFALALWMFISPEQICRFENRWWGRLNIYREEFWASTYYYLILTQMIVYALMSSINIFHAWRKSSSPTEIKQYRNFLIGFGFGYTAMIDFFVARGLNVYQFGYVSFSLFILVMSYTIIRHQFLEVDLTVKKVGLIFLIYTILIATLTPVFLPVLQNQIKGMSSGSLPALFVISLCMGGVLSMGPIIYAYLVKNSFWLKGQISTGLAHELKSPLSTIDSLTALLLEGIDSKDNEKQKNKDYLRMIQKQTYRLHSQVKDLLTIAKIQDSGYTLKKSQFDFTGLIEKLVKENKEKAEMSENTVSCDVQRAVIFFGDRAKLEQAVSNLISNALKFTQKGTIHIQLKSKLNNLTLSIKDSGRGIPSEELPEVFHRFFQGKNSTKGSGIGLSIAKTWIEAHNGRIWAESGGEGKGTNILFSLPF